MSSFPGSLDSYTTKTDNVDYVLAAHVNSLQSAIVAIETELGTDPAGTVTDVKTRLSKAISGAGMLQFASATTLTIATGAVTVTQNYHRIDTEGASSSDDLDTITAMSEAHLLILRTVSGARNVVIKHGTGNIRCAGGADILLDNPWDMVLMIYDATLSYWIASGGHATGMTTSTKTADYSASITDDLIVCNGSGIITITLPGATGSGKAITIKNIGGARAVIDGNSTDTVDGDLTQTLYRWESVTVTDYTTGAWAVI